MLRRNDIRANKELTNTDSIRSTNVAQSKRTSLWSFLLARLQTQKVWANMKLKMSTETFTFTDVPRRTQTGKPTDTGENVCTTYQYVL